MIITLEMLKAKKACPEQVEVFKETFGDSVETTLENCLKAVEIGLDIDWAAYNLLTRNQWKAYEEAKAPFWQLMR